MARHQGERERRRLAGHRYGGETRGVPGGTTTVIILDCTGARVGLPDGAVYEAYAGIAAKVADEAAAIWGYLLDAMRRPVSLRLHAEPTAGVDWLGRLPT